MHDIWNPWHGCYKKSEGCQNCYMYTLDKRNDKDGSVIYRTNNFDYPLSKNRQGLYKIQSGELIRVCMTSDFFLEEADKWRGEAWKIIKERSDVKFYLLTKRAQRIKQCLPKDWYEGYDNVILNVTCENQQRADERIPILYDIPAKHKGIMCAPLISPIDISKYMHSSPLEQIIVGGENYEGSRPCHYEWVLDLYKQARRNNITFAFIETGTYFVKDNKMYFIPSKDRQSELAYKSKLQYQGKEISYHLTYHDLEITKSYEPIYLEECIQCGSRLICNGADPTKHYDEHIYTLEEMKEYDKHFRNV